MMCKHKHVIMCCLWDPLMAAPCLEKQIRWQSTPCHLFICLWNPVPPAALSQPSEQTPSALHVSPEHLQQGYVLWFCNIHCLILFFFCGADAMHAMQSSCSVSCSPSEDMKYDATSFWSMPGAVEEEDLHAYYGHLKEIYAHSWFPA